MYRALFVFSLAGALVVGANLPMPPKAPAMPQVQPTVTVSLPPCENEDGPGPCVWEASQRGNGKGHSFFIDCDQVTHYADEDVQRRMDKRVNDPSKKAYEPTC